MPLSNASKATLPLPSHGSGSGWIATPFLHDSFIHYSTPVYPDAIQADMLLRIGLPARRWPASCRVCQIGSEWRPYVVERDGRITVTFYSHTALEGERVVRHVGLPTPRSCLTARVLSKPHQHFAD